MGKARKKVTYYLDEDVVRAARVRAAREDRRDSELVEQALRRYLGFELLDRIWARSDLSEEEAMTVAIEETHAYRDQKRASGST